MIKETTIQFKADYNKVNAVRIFLADKSVSIEDELTDCIDVLYKKYVPQSVRDYIEKNELNEQTDGHGKRGGVKRVKRDLSAGSPGVDNYPSEGK